LGHPEINTEPLFLALETLLTWDHFAYLLVGTFLGLFVGLLPGFGGLAGLSMLLPFIYGMDPSHALALMVGLLAPTTTTDTFPAVLMGIPGTSASQATVLDGFPLAQRGEAARALGAAFTASVTGGVMGALILSLAIVFARPLVLSIGFGEQLMLILVALSLVGMLTGRHAIKGFAACGFGLLIGSIGFAPASGEDRYIFGTTYLMDGIPIVIYGLGLYAIPEIFALIRGNSTVASAELVPGGLWQGVRDTLKNKWLVIRCSALGSFFGAIPGLGGSVIDWLTYAHAIQSSRDTSQFGNGDIRGVIAPEAANNAKEGGALIPTLLFGIPGSGSMAVLLGGFVLVGIQPGISMATNNLHLSYLIMWTAAVGNIVAVIVCFALANPIARLTRVPFGLIAPFMMILITFAAYQASRSWGDLLALFVFGALGISLKQFGWSRPAVLIGAFLAPQLEAAFYQTFQIYGFSFLKRPIVQVLAVVLAVSLLTAIVRPGLVKAKLAPPERFVGRLPHLLLPILIAAVAIFAWWSVSDLSDLGSLFPKVVACGLVVSCAVVIGQLALTRRPSTIFTEPRDGLTTVSGLVRFGVLFALIGLTALIGLVPAAFVYVTVFLQTWWKRHALLSMATGCLAGIALVLISQLMGLQYPPSLLEQFVTYPPWLGGS
jgi:putative tricarboxylic transport membrane protein